MTQTCSVEELAISMGINPVDLERQCELELEGFELGKARYDKRKDAILNDPNKDNSTLKPENHILRDYTVKLIPFVRNLIKPTKGGSKMLREMRQLIGRMPAERLAFLMLRSALNIDPAKSTMTDCCVKLGYEVEMDLQYLSFQEMAPGYLSKVESRLKSSHIRHRHGVLKHCAEKVEIRDKDTGAVISQGIPALNLSPQERFTIGKLLLEIMTEHTGLLKMGSRSHRVKTSGAPLGGIWTEVATLEKTDKLIKVLEENHVALAEASPIVYPSVIPPKPWDDVHGGGFWTQYKSLRSKLIRTRNRKAIQRAKEAGIGRICAVLNAIQATPFRINTKVLAVMEEAAARGLGKLPAPDKELIMVNGTYPLAEARPWSDDEVTTMRAEKSPVLAAWNRQRSKAWDTWYREQSKREALLWQLKIARKFADEPRIYFSWNMDYRGRVYCLQPYINPQVNDSGKSLIQFAEGKALGESGARWLLIHGANEYGFDKAPLDERVQWVKDHHDLIIDCAENPLDGSQFWGDADHPFNFLGFCFEYAGYAREGINYVSHLPVQVDGTCSGLQHYSALLRDEIGGATVNLVPGKTKADVYGKVADVVNLILNDQAKGGDKRDFARGWLEVGVTRSTVKRNVMTFCYGATKPGFCQQLIDDTEIKPAGLDEYKACNYLGDLDWQAVSQTLVKSVEGMGYLQKIAFFVANKGLDVQWTTPIGLRVTQDYLKTDSQRIDTWWGGTRIQPRISVETDKKNPSGSRNGIAPNFIHSLDASHLMLTAEACVAEGITNFSFIHDSFGTHAHDMEDMSRILRETFVTMYSEDLLTKWTDEIRAQVPVEFLGDFEELVAKHKPEMGTLDLNLVKRSPYFFS